MNPTETSRRVREHILHHVAAMPASERGQKWHSSATGRTNLYLRELLPGIQAACGATWSQLELHCFDATFGVEFTDSATGHSNRIPLLFLESENYPDTALHEIERLCWATAPLRVLITVAEWSHERFPRSQNRRRLRDKWDAYISLFHEQSKAWIGNRKGVILILVGECGPDGILRFYSYEFHESSGEFLPGSDVEDVCEIGACPRPPSFAAANP